MGTDKIKLGFTLQNRLIIASICHNNNGSFQFALPILFDDVDPTIMANWNFGNFGFADGDGDEEDDAETGFSWKTSGRDSIILLVDVTRPMFIKQESGETHFELCMKVSTKYTYVVSVV